ncbi:MAG: YlxR family protein [Anaerolineales bacterium]|nr:YlxR family protein [Anaerolineales bacterium]
MSKKAAGRVKHIPQRTCVGCRTVLSKRALIRLVRTPDGIQIDPSGKLAGRGAYLHDRRACWESALKGVLENALKTKMNNDDRENLTAFMETLSDRPDIA